MAKLPAFQFYPGDWMKDPNLRRCSPAARGVWIDLLCLMFECDERGVLAASGAAWSDHDIAAAISGPRKVILEAIQELLQKGVAHRDEAGAIYCKRMVRDEQVRRSATERKRAERGRVSRECHGGVTRLSHPIFIFTFIFIFFPSLTTAGSE